jgi:hypothetical protein|nr:MAG TPA: hypothetical protein [Caudoviricetes sp.]
MTNVTDYFDLSGNMFEEALEFQGVNLAAYIDGRSKIKPDYIDSINMQIKLDNSEARFTKTDSVVYASITFKDGKDTVNTILFKCRQKAHLGMFIRRVIAIAKLPLDRIHREYRNY